LFVNNFLKDISDIKKSVKEDVDEEVVDDQIGHVLKKNVSFNFYTICICVSLNHIFFQGMQDDQEQIVVNKSKEEDKEVYKLVEYI
jgi:hypothetical protein